MNVRSLGSARGPVYISAIVSHSLAYDKADVMDSDNQAIALSDKIQINIPLIGTVRKQSVEPIVFAKRWGTTPDKAEETIQVLQLKYSTDLTDGFACQKLLLHLLHKILLN